VKQEDTLLITVKFKRLISVRSRLFVNRLNLTIYFTGKSFYRS